MFEIPYPSRAHAWEYFRVRTLGLLWCSCAVLIVVTRGIGKTCLMYRAFHRANSAHKLDWRLAVVWILTTASGCNGAAKTATKAAEHAQFVAALVTKDVGEVTRGLPEGAKRAPKIFYDGGNDPAKDPIAVRRGLNKVQVAVPDLLTAKSTFFALADANGIAIRNNLEVDAMAGTDLFKLFPDLRQKAVDGRTLELALGEFPGTRNARTWMAASPIKNAGDSTVGYLVTGWSFKQFAHHLQESLVSQLKSALLADKQGGKLPIIYVAVFDESGIYTDPTTPDVIAAEVAKLNVMNKTATGPIQGVFEDASRTFGYAARRTPELSAQAGIAILRSEI
jgi:hypothetical protein